MNGVVITGVGMHPFGRFDGTSTTDMGVFAVRQALRQAGSVVADSVPRSAARPMGEWRPATRCSAASG